MVFAAPERNPCITILMSTAMKHAGLPPRDPFQPGGLMSLGKPGLVDSLFTQAGLHDVATTSIDAPFKMPSVRHYIDFVRSSASPVLQILARLEPAAADAAWAAATSPGPSTTTCPTRRSGRNPSPASRPPT